MNPTLEAVLFDCDGVIADSEEWWNEIDHQHLSHYGVPNYHGEDKEHVIGKSFFLSESFYRERFNIAAPIEAMIEDRTQVAARIYAEHIPTFAGVTELLRELRADGLKLALATSSVSRLILPFLERTGIAQSFDVIITGEMVKNGKPHPDIYLLAAEKVGAQPAACLVVEDALAGLQAGRSAGCITCSIPDSRWLDPILFENQSDFKIERIPQVLDVVRTLRGKASQNI